MPMPSRHSVLLVTGVTFLFTCQLDAKVRILTAGQAQVAIVADTREATAAQAESITASASWLGESLEASSGVQFEVAETLQKSNAFILGLKSAWPKIAESADFNTERYDDYAIVTDSEQQTIHVLGNSDEAVRHGVADLLRRWGFRFFAPSKRWHITPHLSDLTWHETLTESPPLIERRIWYAYGQRSEDLETSLMDGYNRWAAGNRLTLRGLTRTGHSYGNIIGRNQQAFANNPELSAMLADGTRDVTSVANARKFCVRNPDLVSLVVQDRLELLRANQRVNPSSFMVSVDPSDGQGTCHCDRCAELGSTTDRVMHLANETAKYLKQQDKRAWVGLYAYSSHRLPPTIDVEPNVYVQVALGFNRTQYSLPELVDRWSQKVSAIGLREYYGVEAWDWGLPGRARGGQVEYHQKWIPFYAKRNLNGINAETNANWGAQALGLYVASQLLWNPDQEVEPLLMDFFDRLFGDAAGPMRQFYQLMEEAPPLRPATLLPLFEQLDRAWKLSADPAVRARLTDLRAYLVYVAMFRDFDLVRGKNAERNNAYYEALLRLMNYAWRIRHRDVIHYYALARRLCNGLPVQDNRLEFYMANKDAEPVWKTGAELSDAEINGLYVQVREKLLNDDDPTVSFSRYFDRVRVEGKDAGPAYIHAQPQEDKMARSRFRGGLLGYLVASGPQTAKLDFRPTSKPIEITVYMRSEEIFQKRLEASAEQSFQEVEIQLPRAFEYRIEITGDFEIQIPAATPLLFESSVTRPAWISYSGPHYFYVPRGTRELIVDANPRFSVVVPGKGRLDVGLGDRVDGSSHIVIEVPEGADGTLWHTTTQTRGKVMLLNTSPLFSFHRNTVFVPREVSESEGLSTTQ